MALKIGYQIWNSSTGLDCGQSPLTCGSNPFPASLIPTFVSETGRVIWHAEKAVGNEWSTVTGARNGIAVEVETGGIKQLRLYDVKAEATSDEDEDSPYNKLAVWLSSCCEDCDPDVTTIDGEYNGTYHALGATEFCYTVTVGGVTENPTAYALDQIAMMIVGIVLKSDINLVSYNEGTNVLVFKMCVNRALTSTGYPIGFPTSHPSLGTTLTWAFAEA